MSVIALQASGILTPFHGAGGYQVGLAVPGIVDAAEMVREKKHEERA
jgi:hypothetical protein